MKPSSYPFSTFEKGSRLAEDMKIIQSPTVFAFSLDAVLLSKFAYVPIQKGKIVDLCTGNGIVPLLLSTY